MYMNRLIISITTLLAAVTASAAVFTTTGLEPHDGDMSAVVYQVKDRSGQPCALIKAEIDMPGLVVGGDGIKSMTKDGALWIYVPGGDGAIALVAPGVEPFRYEYKGLKKNVTYSLPLTLTETGLRDVVTVEVTPPANTVNVTGQTQRAKSPVSFDMVLVANGEFKMGATPEQTGADDDEKPVRRVYIPHHYYIGQTEVTQRLWELVMGNNPSKFKNPDNPVENITWQEAREFAARLSSMTGARFRLPTEAEWEYAARGGHKAVGHIFAGSDNAREVAWYAADSHFRPQPVKSLKPNEIGAYDMSGNVYEFCSDYKADYDKRDLNDPKGPSSGKQRVRRGGAYDSEDTGTLRTAFRRRVEENTREGNTGLRIVMEVDQ